jgi:hypothetical protein
MLSSEPTNTVTPFNCTTSTSEVLDCLLMVMTLFPKFVGM